MTVQECYHFLDADYENTIERFEKEERLCKYLQKFAKDKTFYSLVLRLGERNYQEAFRTAHDLKGLCLNLGLTKLYEDSNTLCDVLREAKDAKEVKEVHYVLQAVMVEYERTVAAIKMLDCYKLEKENA